MSDAKIGFAVFHVVGIVLYAVYNIYVYAIHGVKPLSPIYTVTIAKKVVLTLIIIIMLAAWEFSVFYDCLIMVAESKARRIPEFITCCGALVLHNIGSLSHQHCMQCGRNDYYKFIHHEEPFYCRHIYVNPNWRKFKKTFWGRLLVD